MPEEPRDETPKPKTSAELIAEARSAFGTDSPSVEEASEDLMDRARGWLEGNAAADPEPMALPALVLEPEIDEEIGKLFEPPPSRPVGRRPRAATRRIPAPIPDSGRPTRRRRRVLGLAATIGVIALLSNVTALVINSESDSGPELLDSTVTVSEGSISSAVDPCSGATIAGDLVAVITYSDDRERSLVEVTITGSQLLGSDGSTYSLTVNGASYGDPGQAEFVFESDVMEMVRDDGLVITDFATLTIEMDGRDATNWSYSSEGANCEA
jgi:hypothetical protein